MKSREQEKGKLGHVAQIDVNVMLNLSICSSVNVTLRCSLYQQSIKSWKNFPDHNYLPHESSLLPVTTNMKKVHRPGIYLDTLPWLP